MKTPNFGNLGTNTAAALNSGTLGVNKDKIVHLDPVTEILYDPEENIRNGKVIDDSLDNLVALRLGIDGEQLQAIRVYPLPANKLDPAKPAMKYGIAFGHRRTLACRLTSEDSPLIKGNARKVKAVIDVNWLKKGRAYRLRCQIEENTQRLDLNPVELGQALREYQRELSQEEGRHISQADLMKAYHLKEKTVYNLLKAADFHQIAKDLCHGQLLNDLDTMVTFDAICKVNEPLGRAIYESLNAEGAPSHRSLIRKARILADDKDYVFDPLSWEWPGSVEHVGAKPATVLQMPATANVGQGPNPSTPPVEPNQSADVASNGQTSNPKPGTEGAGANTEQTNTPQTPSRATPPAKEPGDDNREGGNGGGTDAVGTQPTTQARNPAAQTAPIPQGANTGLGPIIMVEFKMGAEASSTFHGELLVDRDHIAKRSGHGVVAYLNDGREELIEVPLQHIKLLSLNHQ